MKIVIPTNDRKTVAPHTGKCKEFAFFEIENGKVISTNYEVNSHSHHHGESCCGRHSEEKQQHNHKDLIEIISKADLLLYFGMGKGLREDLDKENIKTENTNYPLIDYKLETRLFDTNFSEDIKDELLDNKVAKTMEFLFPD